MENYESLINELIKLPSETSWVEFKHDNYNPDMIGESISALANSAAYYDRDKAYMVWGIDDKTHEVVGTNKNQHSVKVGEQELENWLRGLLSSNCEFEFKNFMMNNKYITLLIIYRASHQTVTFKKEAYIRVGSYKKKLKDYPSMNAQLWDRIRTAKFEDIVSEANLEVSDIINKLDFNLYFELKGIPLPNNNESIIHYMLEESVIKKQDNGLYSITNLGAILFSRKITDFPKVGRKAIRVIQYKGNNKLEILKEHTILKGYVIGFESLMEYMSAMLPSEEIFDSGIRKTKTMYPDIALREIIANSLIHQDFSVSGAGPVVEVFENRLEVTNPGVPLVNISRIVDNPPRSRNEKLASLLRQLKICEEAGSGWDRIVISCEVNCLPAPKIDLYEDSIKVIMYNEKEFYNISNEDRIWSCYLHACIKYLEGSALTNATLRERFGLTEKGSAPISRLIKEAMEKGLIKPINPETAPRYMKYIPKWV